VMRTPMAMQTANGTKSRTGPQTRSPREGLQSGLTVFDLRIPRQVFRLQGEAFLTSRPAR
jgi:hypothetical protein